MFCIILNLFCCRVLWYIESDARRPMPFTDSQSDKPIPMFACEKERSYQLRKIPHWCSLMWNIENQNMFEHPDQLRLFCLCNNIVVFRHQRYNLSLRIWSFPSLSSSVLLNCRHRKQLVFRTFSLSKWRWISAGNLLISGGRLCQAVIRVRKT